MITNPHIILAVLHLLIIVPFLLYIGIAREQVPDSVFKGVLGLGFFVALYQSYKAYTHIQAGTSPWINYIHIFLLAPLLIIIGYNGKNANRKYFEMLLMLAFAATGYHSLSIIREIMAR
jgi:hypothetical protein